MKNPVPFSIDTRTIQPGDVFIALDGVNVKGVSYLRDAFGKGASAAWCAEKDRAAVPAEFLPQVLFSDNPAFEMARQAAEWRAAFVKPVIGLAGSVGKTSTKQFLAYLLGRKKNVLATSGNFNNQLGLPMMISRLKPEHDIAVLEMGADHVGDLAKLVEIAQPDVGVLTPIAPEHLLGFGSLAGVYDGELEILLSKRLKTLVTVSGDAELDLRLKKFEGRVIRAGFDESADVRITDLLTKDSKTHCRIHGQPVILPTAASFLALNAGIAAAAAVEAGLSWQDICGEWTPEMPKGRFAQRKIARDITVIDDTYNSSPKAFAAAVEALGKMNFKRKWVVFSDMLELGTESLQWHAALADDILRSQIDAAWAYGRESKAAIEKLNGKAGARWFPEAEALASDLADAVRPGDAVLFKGSRGMRVEKVLELLEKKLSN